jgi:hypothetical protein
MRLSAIDVLVAGSFSMWTICTLEPTNAGEPSSDGRFVYAPNKRAED